MAKVIAVHIDQNGLNKFYLNAGYMLAYAKKFGHSAEFFMENADSTVISSAGAIKNANPDCVIFTLAKYNYNISISLADWIKKIAPEVLIIFGGFFAVGNAELLLSKYKFIDGCFLSEGEESLLSVLTNIDNGKSVFENVNHVAFCNKASAKVERIFNHTEQIDLNLIPSPYEDIIDPVEMNKQYGCVYISSSRGCKFACTYCYHPLIRKRIRHYDINYVVEEIKSISHKFNRSEEILIDFWDDFFISDRDYTINLCREIEKRNDEFGCTVKIKIDTRIDYIDEELLNFLKKANVYFIGFGLENIDITILSEMNKLGTDATSEDYVNFLSKFYGILEKCKELGIRTGLYIIHGWHNETLKMAKNTLKFCEKLEPNEIHQNQLAYYKGSKIYPVGYEDQFYLQYFSNPELYKYNLDKVPDSKLDPFIEHYNANHKFLILTGICDSKENFGSRDYFQNIIVQGTLDGKFIYENCYMSTCISLFDKNMKTFFIQSTPLHDLRFDEVLDSQKVLVKVDKWHKISKKSVLSNKNKLCFYPVNLSNTEKLKNYIASGRMNLIPQNVCAISEKCACENNYRIFVASDSNFYTCNDGIMLGTQKDSAKVILRNYEEIKRKNEKLYDCKNCEIREKCSKCPKLLQLHGKDYCNHMRKSNFSVYQKYMTYLEKRFYYERPDSTKDFYFADKKMGEK